jgi:shikimate dehydrogenase
VSPSITGATRLAGVIGSPVRHSLSPALHNAAFDALGLDWRFVAFDVPSGCAADALVGMRALGIGGLSVTMPHKQDVARAVDVLHPAARALDAVNCVVRLADGRLEGRNTDGAGFLDSLVDHGVAIAARSFVVLGAGGAARAVVAALGEAGAASVVVVARSAAPAQLAAGLAGPGGRVGTMADVPGAEVVVNATPVGMGSSELPLDRTLLHAGQVVVDLVYQPLDTALLKAARSAGASSIDGLGMLVHQAARAFETWTGQPAPVVVMRAAAEAELARRTSPA